MIIRNLISTPTADKLTFGLLLYKISLIVCVIVIAIFTLLLGGSILFIGWASGASSGSSEGVVMMMILPMLFLTWACIGQVPFGVYGIIYNRRYTSNTNRKQQMKMLSILTIFCSLPPLGIFLSYPGIIFNIIYNFTGKNLDLTNYSSYSIIKKEIDSCNIDFVDWRPINDVGGYFKGNVHIDVYVKEPPEHERYNLKAIEKNRLYTDLSQSTCNYSKNNYETLKGTDYNGEPY